MIRIGISGWTYTPWRGKFYPEGLAQKRELEYASRQFNSIEINGTFYSLQRPGSYQTWYEQTPDDFVYSMKGPRFITHMKRLKDVDAPLANFFASGILCLKEKLGPVLWQFPPNFRFDLGRFERFFAMLPHNTEDAAKLARMHDAKVKGRAWTETDENRRIRYALEFRHDTFLVPDFVKLLRKHKIAMCIADTGKKFPYAEDITADFAYLRLHGPEEIYASGYSDSDLKLRANRIAAWAAGGEPKDAHRIVNEAATARKKRDIFIYFDNDLKVKAPFDAMRLRRLLNADRP